MPDILHRVGINARPDKVFSALATLDGVRGWWVSTATGKGDSIDFGFCVMKVVKAAPDTLVHWRCTRGPDEWIGTEVIFRLAWKDNQTFVIFTHAGWKQAVEFMHHCSTKWATFLLSLREFVESGAGRPDPHDLKIHVGD